MVKLTEERIWRLRGLVGFAHELGVAPNHVRLVYQGRRKSPRVEAALAEHGIKVRPCPKRLRED